MKLKFWGKAWQKGLTLTADLYTTEGIPVYRNFPMVETIIGETAIYKTQDILPIIGMLQAGIKSEAKRS